MRPGGGGCQGVGVLVSNGCDQVGLEEPLIITAIEVGDLLKIFPNPVRNYLNITGMNSPSKLLLIDMKGQVVLRREEILMDKFDVSGLKPGLYLLQIESQGKFTTTKVFKE